MPINIILKLIEKLKSFYNVNYLKLIAEIEEKNKELMFNRKNLEILNK